MCDVTKDGVGCACGRRILGASILALSKERISKQTLVFRDIFQAKARGGDDVLEIVGLQVGLIEFPPFEFSDSYDAGLALEIRLFSELLAIEFDHPSIYRVLAHGL